MGYGWGSVYGPAYWAYQGKTLTDWRIEKE